MNEHERTEAEDIIRAIRQGEVDAFVVREAAEERIYSLRSADVLYRAMIEQMNDGAVALDRSGLVLYCNPCFAQLVKAERGAIVGGKISSFVPLHADDLFALFEDEGGAALDAARHRELELRASDGTVVPVLAAMNRIRLDETNQVHCLVVTDLTEQKQRDQLLVEGRRKDEFLAMLAHELRNPIAPIRYAAERLRFPGMTEERLQWAREVIGRQVDQLTRLVDDLLDVSRITRGKIGLNLEPVEIDQVIAGAVESVRPLIEARRQEFRITQLGTRLRVQGDPVRLAQAISNLLHNASKFTPEQGQIDLEVQKEEAGSGEGGEGGGGGGKDQLGAPAGWVRIVVTDNGPGIAPEIVSQMFNLFVQGDDRRGRSQGGLGIGLMLVRTFIEMHGGTVTGETRGQGQGSRFTVRLPLLLKAAEPARPAAAGASPAADAVTARKILVVDDNIDVAESLAGWLHDCGHDVHVARTGEEAVAEAQAFVPDVVLIDIGLPDVSGHEVARRLRQIPATARALLVALTGFGQAEDLRLSRAAGFDQHWIKPVSVDVLAALLAPKPVQSAQPVIDPSSRGVH